LGVYRKLRLATMAAQAYMEAEGARAAADDRANHSNLIGKLEAIYGRLLTDVELERLRHKISRIPATEVTDEPISSLRIRNEIELRTRQSMPR
jgi:hypothetical protein